MLKKISTTNQILISSALAIILGSVLGEKMQSIQFIGTMWLKLIQMSIIILIMTSIANAIGNIEGGGAGKLSFHTFKYIIIFTFISAFIGLGMALLIKPGAGISIPNEIVSKTELASVSIADTFVNFIPSNIFAAMSEGNTVQCIVFALVFGIAGGKYAKESKRDDVLLLLKDINSIIMKIIEMIMRFAPIGIFALLGAVAGTTGLAVIMPMVKFLGAILISDIIMFMLYIPYTSIKLAINPLKMAKKFLKMSIMALTITSSAVCLPTKMEDSVKKFGSSKRVSDFTGPITMTMNSSGAVACYVIAIIFMAQSTGVNLQITEILMGILLAAMMCMGTITVPGGSVVVYTFFASALNLPMDSIAILIGIDWFAGSLRTIMNVDIDVLISMLVSHDLGEFNKDVYNDVISA